MYKRKYKTMSKYAYIRLSSGLAIYKQNRSKNWYIRMRINDDNSAVEFRQSLKVQDQDEATKKAWGYYYANENDLNRDVFIKVKRAKISNLA